MLMLKARFNKEGIEMNKYWVQALSTWAPEIPSASHINFNDPIKAISELQQENEELRKDLENAVAIIHYLDYCITELKAKISLLNEDKD